MRTTPLDHWRMLDVLAHEVIHQLGKQQVGAKWEDPPSEGIFYMSYLIYQCAVEDPRFNAVGLVRRGRKTVWIDSETQEVRPIWDFLGYGYCVANGYVIDRQGEQDDRCLKYFTRFFMQKLQKSLTDGWDFVKQATREVEEYYELEPLPEGYYRFHELMPNKVRDESLAPTQGRYATKADHSPKKAGFKPHTDDDRKRYGLPPRGAKSTGRPRKPRDSGDPEAV